MSEIPKNLFIEKNIWESGVKRIAGVDEVGRGPLAGPVVAAAVIFEPYRHIEGVTDSKKLTQKRREAYFEEITTQCLSYAVGIVPPAEIDRINIRQATFKAMRMAIGKLSESPEYLLIDGEELPDKIYPQEGIIKGDFHSFTIAAASIIAKVTRDALMRDYHDSYPEYGFDRHKGYGTAAHCQVLRERGATPIHRKSFLGKILPDLK